MRSFWSSLVAVAAAAFFPLTAFTQPVLVTAAKTIGPLDTTITPTAGGPPIPLATAQITVQNAPLTINGRHSISSLDLQGSAVVRHTAAFSFDYSGNGSDIVNGFELSANSITIAPTASIDVTGLGYPNAAGPGAGTSSDGSAGSYAGGGGYGGNGDTVTTPGGSTYGSFTQPTQFGSGGGNYGGGPSVGGAGGGAVRLSVSGTLVVDGVIRANGASPANSVAGRGAGGSLWITTNNLVGAGFIEANGAGPSNGGAGGGGRVAVAYTSSSFLGGIRALASTRGGTGTVYISDNGVNTLIFDNGGLNNRTDYSQAITVNGNLIIRGGVGLGHPVGAPTGLAITVTGNATIEPSGVIDASERGYTGGAGPGAGMSSDGTAGSYAGGVGHGGNGETVTTPGGATYGSFTQPAQFGSGGGNYGTGPSIGGVGGGIIRLTVGGTLVVDGSIRANGGAPLNSVAGRGAGGSLWITTSSFVGSGIVEANGGGPSNGGAGGGGRVAVEYASSSFVGAVRALGSSRSGTGTVYFSHLGNSNTLIFDNAGTSNRTDYAQPITVNGHLIVRGGVGLGHPAGVPGGLDITVSGNATIEPSGVVDVSARGHPGGVGPGAGVNSLGNPGEYAGGGGYGGNGQAAFTPGGPTYGTFTNPADLGSGGGNYGTGINVGGAGGGSLRLVVGGTLVVDGTIRANGGVPANSVAGRGSGGSIWLSTGGFVGSGIIEANGGGPSNGGAGGGGRIAVESASSSFLGAIRAYSPTAGAGTGTVYLSNNGVNTLIFDNGGTANRTDYSQPIIVNGNFIVRGGVGLGHPLGQLSGLPIIVSGNATIESGGVIDLSARGYPGGSGPGAGGNSAGLAGQYAGGGGFGGHGESRTTPGGSPYGTSTRPDVPGSGGGNYGTGANVGGAGGGALQLAVGGVLVVDGTIRSNGGVPSNSVAGRGSGGALWIHAGAVMGSGLIEANGGGPSNGGAGGGGRVAIYSCNFLFPPSQVRALRGSNGAGEGTVHLATATAEVSPPAACLGQDISFNVTTVGNPGTLQWRHNGQPISDGPTPSGAVYAGTNTANLTITNASSAEGGEYDCQVSGSCGAAVTNAVTLLVTCCPDVNCDFALDGFDVEVQERAVGGDMTDYCQGDPDFNRDFALDGFDVEAVELTVGGGPCP